MVDAKRVKQQIQKQDDELIRQAREGKFNRATRRRAWKELWKATEQMTKLEGIK